MNSIITSKELIKAHDLSAVKAEAERLINQGFSIIPLKQNEKFNLDKDILTRDYTLLDLVDPRYGQFPNLGINLVSSNQVLDNVVFHLRNACQLLRTMNIHPRLSRPQIRSGLGFVETIAHLFF